MLELNEKSLESVTGGNRSGNKYQKVVIVLKNFTIKDHSDLTISINF